MKFSNAEMSLMKLLQDDFPLERKPFLALGKAVNLSEEEVVNIVRRWKDEGIIRKLGVAVRPPQVGYKNNILVVWAVPPKAVDIVGMLFAGKEWVSHCYERTPPYLGRYNLFTMIHLPSPEEEGIIEDMAREAGIYDYMLLKTIEELKKTSMRYF